jgi:hypothetical protein
MGAHVMMPHTQAGARHWRILHTLRSQLGQAGNAAATPIASLPMLASASPVLPLCYTGWRVHWCPCNGGNPLSPRARFL